MTDCLKINRPINRFEDIAELDSLEKELSCELNKDARYWNENEAKFRAIRSASSYKEFCDLVQTCHLTPVNRVDKVCAPSSFKLFGQKRLPVKNCSSSNRCGLLENFTCLADIRKFGLEEFKKIFIVEVKPHLLCQLVDLIVKESEKMDQNDWLLAFSVLECASTKGKRFELAKEFLSSFLIDQIQDVFFDHHFKVVDELRMTDVANKYRHIQFLP